MIYSDEIIDRSRMKRTRVKPYHLRLAAAGFIVLSLAGLLVGLYALGGA